MRGALLRAAVATLALRFVACIHDVPPPGLVPTGPAVTRVADLTGEYCYFGPDFNVRSFGYSVDGIPFIQVRDLRTPSLVSVQATAQRIVFRYTGADGTEKKQDFEVANGAVWRGASLLVDWSAGATFLPIPGGFDISGHTRKSQLFKLADGRLVMTSSAIQKGYSETGILSISGTGMHSERKPTFHREERTVAVILDPATGDCDANIEDRPRQPWFERGLDLREPACSAELEAQIASILVEKKVDPEAAALAASDTLGSFERDVPPQEFSASPGPNKRYVFKIAKKKSGCVLKLYLFVGRPVGHSSYASRPLPACACND